MSNITKNICDQTLANKYPSFFGGRRTATNQLVFPPFCLYLDSAPDASLRLPCPNLSLDFWTCVEMRDDSEDNQKIRTHREEFQYSILVLGFNVSMLKFCKPS